MPSASGAATIGAFTVTNKDHATAFCFRPNPNPDPKSYTQIHEPLCALAERIIDPTVLATHLAFDSIGRERVCARLVELPFRVVWMQVMHTIDVSIFSVKSCVDMSIRCLY